MPPSDDIQVEIPKPRMTLRGVGIVAFLWSLYTVSFAFLTAQFGYYPFPTALVSTGLSNVVSGLLVIPVWYLTVRRMDEASWPKKLAAHAVIAPVFTLTWFVLVGSITSLIVGENIMVDGDTWRSSQYLMSSTLIEYALVFSILHGVRTVQRLRLREQQTTELLALARERQLAALKAQINPHFLFNTLNTISATVTRDPEATRAMIGRLSTLLRYAIDSSKHHDVTLRDEVQFARDYLELERQRIPDRLRVDVDVDEAALEARVPPVLLQPLVENAVRHGIAPSEAGGTVTLRVELRSEGLHVYVEDDGVGPHPEEDGRSSPGIGLKNTDARLRRTFGEEAALHTAPAPPHGFRVWFDVPRERLEGLGEALVAEADDVDEMHRWSTVQPAEDRR